MKSLLVLAVIFLVSCNGRGQQNAPRQRPLADATLQAKRAAAIADVGIVRKIKDQEIWVNPGFSLLNYDEKKKLSNVCWNYVHKIPISPALDSFESAALSMNIIDGQTGKKIGTYDGAFGLRLK